MMSRMPRNCNVGNVSVNTSNANKPTLYVPTNNATMMTGSRHMRRNLAFVRVSNPRMCGFTIGAVKHAILGSLRHTNVRLGRLSCFVPRRTGVHVVSSTTGHLRLPVRGIFIGLRGCNGASTTSMTVTLSRTGHRKHFGHNSGITFTKFNTNLA